MVDGPSLSNRDQPCQLCGAAHVVYYIHILLAGVVAFRIYGIIIKSDQLITKWHLAALGVTVSSALPGARVLGTAVGAGPVGVTPSLSGDHAIHSV